MVRKAVAVVRALADVCSLCLHVWRESRDPYLRFKEESERWSEEDL